MAGEELVLRRKRQVLGQEIKLLKEERKFLLSDHILVGGKGREWKKICCDVMEENKI